MISPHIFTGSLVGLNAEPIEVEADARRGVPKFFIVGLPDAMMQEARERVKSALKHSDIPFPFGIVVVNLAPADIRKCGTLYDLPIAIAIAAINIPINEERAKQTILAGELALDGSLRPITGALSLAALARDKGFQNIIVPKINAQEAALIPGVRVFGANHIREVLSHLQGAEPLKQTPTRPLEASQTIHSQDDFSSVRGQEQAKRALEIAAAGSHNILMQGPPGSGKTLLAKCYASILPPLEPEEILEVTQIWSVAGKLDAKAGAMTERPYRAPHHTASGVSLVGGGTVPKPGEISLAHRGVLFLDEFPEFPRPVLENLRQPLEDGIIRVTRVQQSVAYPARFNLVAAMNPCPCGYATDKDRTCSCSPMQVNAYKKRLSGPLLDRIDLMIEVPKVPMEKLMELKEGESSSVIRERIIRARNIQRARMKETGALTNSEMSSDAVRTFVQLDADAKKILEQAVHRFRLSARSYFRLLKVARTIADLAEKERVEFSHIAEAIQYRQE